MKAKSREVISINEKQRCVECGDETGRCEEDSLYHGDTGPLCEPCLDFYEDRFGKDNGYMDKETLGDRKYHKMLDDEHDEAFK